MPIKYCKEHKKWNTMICPFCEIFRIEAEKDQLSIKLKETIEQSNLSMDVVISTIKDLFPNRKFLSSNTMESTPCSLIILCKSQKFANDKRNPITDEPRVMDDSGGGGE